MNDDVDERQSRFDFSVIDIPYQPHSPTSIAAAEEMLGSVDSLRHAVFNYIVHRADYGATDLEGQDDLGLQGSTYRPRRIELQDAGFVVDSGRTRPTRSGRQAVVWIVPVVWRNL